MDEVEILRRKLGRERAARLEAEGLLEEKSRLLFDQRQELKTLNSTLEDRIEASTEQLKRTNAMLTMLHEMVVMAADAETFDEALECCLTAICRLSGCPVGHIYKIAANKSDTLASSGIWYFDQPRNFNSFRDVTEETEFKAGIGLPGRIWSSGEPVWIPDVRLDTNCPRAQAGKGFILRSGFGFPVKIRGRLVAVLEFFHEEVMQRNDQLLAILQSMGEQVGRVLERQESLREQKAARRDADKANQAKSRFLANMSHEIRTPMNAILGMTELVLEGTVTEAQREYLLTVLASGESLLALVNDILDLSKIEADAVDLERAAMNLHQVVFGVTKSMATQAHVKNLELLCTIGAGVPEFVVGDKMRIQQVLINLLGNAIKFTQQGEIELVLELVTKSGDESDLKFSVRDTGIGIAPEKQKTVFREFEQADASTTRQFGGTGLGLSIVAKLVEMMGGKVQLESQPQHGTVVGFTLPQSHDGTAEDRHLLDQDAAPSLYETDDGQRIELKGTTVMVIDGNRRNQEILQEWMTRFGAEVTVASNVPEALQCIAEHQQSGRDFDCVLIDSNVTCKSGKDAILVLQAETGTKVNFMMMQQSSGYDVLRCDSLGIENQFGKPLNCSEVLHVLHKLHEPALTLGVETKEATDSRRISSLKVLIVEDSLLNQKLTVAMLHKLGHESVIANNGKEALEYLSSNEFDLVLMDIQMPEMDGFETLAWIRAREEKPYLPVVALTANAMTGDREACLAAGMDAYLSKPIRLQGLSDVITDVAQCNS